MNKFPPTSFYQITPYKLPQPHTRHLSDHSYAQNHWNPKIAETAAEIVDSDENVLLQKINFGRSIRKKTSKRDTPHSPLPQPHQLPNPKKKKWGNFDEKKKNYLWAN